MISSLENIGTAGTGSCLSWPSNLRRVGKKNNTQKFLLSQSPLGMGLDAADGHLHVEVEISL